MNANTNGGRLRKLEEVVPEAPQPTSRVVLAFSRLPAEDRVALRRLARHRREARGDAPVQSPPGESALELLEAMTDAELDESAAADAKIARAWCATQDDDS